MTWTMMTKRMMRMTVRMKVCICLNLLLSAISRQTHLRAASSVTCGPCLADALERAVDDDEDDEEDEEGDDDDEEEAPALVSRPQARRSASPDACLKQTAWDADVAAIASGWEEAACTGDGGNTAACEAGQSSRRRKAAEQPDSAGGSSRHARQQQRSRAELGERHTGASEVRPFALSSASEAAGCDAGWLSRGSSSSVRVVPARQHTGLLRNMTACRRKNGASKLAALGSNVPKPTGASSAGAPCQ